MKINCKICCAIFDISPSQFKRIVCCSKKCSAIRKSQVPPYWKGRKKSKEHIEKMRKTLTGRKLSDKHIMNLRIAKKGIKFSQSHKNNLAKSKFTNGKTISKGYVFIYKPNHPFARKNGVGRRRLYVRQSRLIMEKHLGRYLTRNEVVHHINRIKDDDRIENLRLFSSHSEHIKFHNSQKDIGWGLYWKKKH